MEKLNKHITKVRSRLRVKPAAEQSIVPSHYFDEPKKCFRIFLNGSSIVGRYNQLLYGRPHWGA